MSCRCKTINLAVESIDTLKKMESKLQKFPELRLQAPNACRQYEPMPAPPGQVSRKKIMVCTTRPVQFQCPPVPCICPPCPVCPTYTEKTVDLIKTGIKLFVFYCFVKWTINENLWGGHSGTSKFTLEFMDKNFPSKNGTVALPSLQMLKYNILNLWDKVVGNLFYYSFTMPLKVLSQITDGLSDEEENIGLKESQMLKQGCKKCPS